MTSIKTFLMAALLMVTSAQAKVTLSGEEDVLVAVSKKLSQIDSRLKDNRLYITPVTPNWTEINHFKEELMFVVANDPSGPITEIVPGEVLPSQLTLKLRTALQKLENSALQIGTLTKEPEWIHFKEEMEKFLTFREQFLYGQARAMIRSGVIASKMDRLKDAAAVMMKGTSDEKNVSVRVIDPVIEGLTLELNVLNKSVSQLKELTMPKQKEIKTIFQAKNLMELIMVLAAGVVAGFLTTMSFIAIKKAFTKPQKVEPAPVNNAAFDYYDWLKRLETSLKAFKNNEENLTEEHLKLKSVCQTLSEARTGLNTSDNHQDYYEFLAQVNSSAAKLEEYFEKMDVKKNAEMSRKVMKVIVQLCEVIEARQEIAVAENKTKASVELKIA